MADAAYEIITTPSSALSGQLLLDEDFLRTRGVTDFGPYAADGVGADLETDIFVDAPVA